MAQPNQHVIDSDHTATPLPPVPIVAAPLPPARAPSVNNASDTRAHREATGHEHPTSEASNQSTGGNHGVSNGTKGESAENGPASPQSTDKEAATLVPTRPPPDPTTDQQQDAGSASKGAEVGNHTGHVVHFDGAALHDASSTDDVAVSSDLVIDEAKATNDGQADEKKTEPRGSSHVPQADDHTTPVLSYCMVYITLIVCFSTVPQQRRLDRARPLPILQATSRRRCIATRPRSPMSCRLSRAKRLRYFGINRCVLLRPYTVISDTV